MKLFLNYTTGSTTGSGKITFTDIHELLLIDDALKHYKDYLINKPGEKSDELLKKIDDLERLIFELHPENAEKAGKMYDSSIGINLNNFLVTMRRKSKIPLPELAEHLGMSPSYYSSIEKEKTEASPETLMAIFEYLNVLQNIRVKLHNYLPAIEYFYKDVKIHEIFFENKDEYKKYVEAISKKLPVSSMESVMSKFGL